MGEGEGGGNFVLTLRLETAAFRQLGLSFFLYLEEDKFSEINLSCHFSMPSHVDIRAVYDVFH